MSGTPLLPAPNSVQRARTHRHGLSWGELIRLVLPASVIAAFLLFILTASIVDQTGHHIPWEKQPDVVFPDFSHYKFLQTLPESHFPIHTRDEKRLITIGDIHGMNKSLSALLAKTSYDPRSDTLIHLGDIFPKSKKLSPDPVLDFMSTNSILGVRGNNDQKVVEWRAWMDWIISLPGGREWLEDMDSIWSHVDGDVPSAEFNTWLKKSHKKWLAYVPDGWELQGKHYSVARDMSVQHFDYLCSLPLVLYAPTAHTYFVHAGLLAADPTLEITDPRQPLSHLPTATNPDDGDNDLILRGLQELALLNEIPQNQDPWVLMNMRSLTEDGEVEDGKQGMPWADLWNDVMGSCTQTELRSNLSKYGSTIHSSLQCFPSMVIYGHAAARDLDVKRWSVGTDTGCAYGRRLTAVVLDANSASFQTDHTDASWKDSIIPYGDQGTARIVSVECHA